MINDTEEYKKISIYQKVINRQSLETDRRMDYQGILFNFNRQERFDRLKEIIKPFFNVLKEKKKHSKNFIEKKKGIFEFNSYHEIKNVELVHFQLHNCAKFVTNNDMLYLSKKGIYNYNFNSLKKKKILELKNPNSINYSKSHNLIIGDHDKTKCYIYNLKKKKMIYNEKIFETENCYLNYGIFDKNKILLAGNELYISEKNLENFKNSQKIKTKAFVNHMDLSKKGILACAEDAQEIEIIDRRQNKNNILLKGHDDFNFCVKFLSENLLASGGQDITTRIWDLRKYDKEITLLDGFKTGISAFEFLEEKNYLFVLEYFGYVYCYDLSKGVVVRKSYEFFSNVSGFSLNFDEKKLGVTLSRINGIDLSGIGVFDVM